MSSSLQALVVIDRDLDDSEREDLAAQLKSQLEDLDVDAVEQVVSGSAPDGAKSGALIAIGHLLIKVGPSALSALVNALKNWVARTGSHSVDITIDGDTLKLATVTEAEQDRLVQMFIERHAVT